MPTATQDLSIAETALDQLLAELDELMMQATSTENEGDDALAIRSIAW